MVKHTGTGVEREWLKYIDRLWFVLVLVLHVICAGEHTGTGAEEGGWLKYIDPLWFVLHNHSQLQHY